MSLVSFELATLFPARLVATLNLFTGLKLVAGRFDVLLRKQGCSVG
jgi:hypothetical protein